MPYKAVYRKLVTMIYCDDYALRLRSHRNIRYTVFAIRYSVFAIRYTGTAVHIEVAHAFSELFS